jgi:hypothetical protein
MKPKNSTLPEAQNVSSFLNLVMIIGYQFLWNGPLRVAVMGTTIITGEQEKG